MSFLDDIGFNPSFSNPGDVLGNGNPLTGSGSQDNINANTYGQNTENTQESGSSTTANSGQSNSSQESTQNQQSQFGKTNSQQGNTTSNTGSNTASQQAGRTSSTEKSGISQEGLLYLLNQTLGGNQGLSNLLSGEKSAGVYDSATTQLLASDFLNRAAGEVQARNLTVVKSGENTQAGQEQGNISNTGSSNILGQESGGESGSSTGVTTGQNNTSNNSQTNTAANKSVQGDNTKTSNVDETATGHQGLLSSLGGGSGIGALAGATVVCTELHNRKIISSEVYFPGVEYSRKLSRHIMRGYHFWAIPYVRIMRRKDWIGAAAVKIITPLVVGRGRYICGEFTVLGWISRYILEPVNYILGRFIVSREKVKQLRISEFSAPAGV